MTAALPADWDLQRPLLRAEGLVKRYPVRRGLLDRRRHMIAAVDGVDLTLAPGQTLGIVGESGCGKSTLARLLVALEAPTEGNVTFAGQDLAALAPRRLRAMRSQIQIVLQDSNAALDPRMTVQQSVTQPWDIHRPAMPHAERRVQLAALLERVGLDPQLRRRYPHQLSGGQRQRVAIARALTLDPSVLVLDEPVSALDVSVRAQIINLLTDLQQERGFAAIVIAHDLALVRHLSDRVAVMYLGRIVEEGPAETIYDHPSHPYTQALRSAVLDLSDASSSGGGNRIRLVGELPSAIDPPSGCQFRTRCWKAEPLCAESTPELRDRGQGHPCACHFAASSAMGR